MHYSVASNALTTSISDNVYYFRSYPKLELTVNSDFFGLKHPMVKNMLQDSQGADLCTGYARCKYETVKDNSTTSEVLSESDPTNNLTELLKILIRIEDQ